jgi:hypothetical protein
MPPGDAVVGTTEVGSAVVECGLDVEEEALVPVPSPLSFGDRARHLDGYSHADLTMLVIAREDALEEKAAQMRAAMKSSKHYKQRCEQLIQELKESQLGLTVLQRMSDFKPGRQVTTFGGYSLAFRRNVAHASARATAAMVTAGTAGGEVHDPKTVILYEHRLAIGKTLRSQGLYQALDECDLAVEVHQYKGDGTHQQAIEKSKVHVSSIASSVCTLGSVQQCAGADHRFDLELFGSQVVSTTTFGDLQTVILGTGAETYGLALRQFASVGCPSWEDRGTVAAAAVRPNLVSIYTMVLDAGPDNQGMLKRVKHKLKHCPSVMVLPHFCMLHQAHLITKGILGVLDRWSWGEGHEWPVKYFSGVATIANVWRATGHFNKIRSAAVREFDEQVGDSSFGKAPGRCLRGRWLAVDSVERIICSASGHIGKVFHTCFAEPAKKRKREISTCADDVWEVEQTTYKRHAVALANNRVFLATVAASRGIKSPLVHFMTWAQKAVKAHNKSMAGARATGETYMGPTPMSSLISYKGLEIKHSMDDLLDPEAGGGDAFEAVWSICPAELMPEMLKLIVSAVLNMHAAWDFRFMVRLHSFPLKLLLFLEAAPCDQDARRHNQTKH